MTKLTKLNIFMYTIRVVTWIFQVFNLRISRPHSDFEKILLHLEQVRLTRGTTYAVSYVKASRSALMNYLAGSPLKKVKGVKLTRDGIPSFLGPLIPCIRRDESPDILRVLTTILWCTRALRFQPVWDLQPISGESKQLVPDLSMFIRDFWAEMGYGRKSTLPRRLLWRSFHLSTKSGPTGPQNAMSRALCDLQALPISLEESIRFIGGTDLGDKMDML